MSTGSFGMDEWRVEKLKDLGADFIRQLSDNDFDMDECQLLLLWLMESLSDVIAKERLKVFQHVAEISKQAIGKDPREN